LNKEKDMNDAIHGFKKHVTKALKIIETSNLGFAPLKCLLNHSLYELEVFTGKFIKLTL